MNYLPENTETLHFFEVADTLDVIEVNPLDSDTYKVLGKIENVLPGKYTVIKNTVSEEIDEEEMIQEVYAHVFILHESIANLPLNDHQWSRKNTLFFDFLGRDDDCYVAVVSSHQGIKEFQDKNIQSEYNQAQMVESLDSGITFACPSADYGQGMDYLKLNDKFVGFRVQGVGKIYDIEITNKKPSLKI